MTKKILSLILAAMILAVSACSSGGTAQTTTTAAVAPSAASDYEFYIEDMDYFMEKYFNAFYSSQTDFATLNESEAKKHVSAALEALTSLEGVIYPPDLEEVHSEFIHAVGLQKELFGCMMETADYLSDYNNLSDEDDAALKEILVRTEEARNRIEEDGYFYNKWIAAQNAAFSRLPNGSYKAYNAELETLWDLYVAEFNKLFDVYFADGEGDVSVFSNNCTALLFSIENMTVPEELKSSHDEIIKVMSAEKDVHEAVITISRLYSEHPRAVFEDLPSDVQEQIMECDEILKSFFSENNTEYYALYEAVIAALESADTLAGQ